MELEKYYKLRLINSYVKNKGTDNSSFHHLDRISYVSFSLVMKIMKSKCRVKIKNEPKDKLEDVTKPSHFLYKCDGCASVRKRQKETMYVRTKDTLNTVSLCQRLIDEFAPNELCCCALEFHYSELNKVPQSRIAFTLII